MTLFISPKDVNLYAVLGLPTPSSTSPVSSAQIRAAYRSSLLQHHPDKARSQLPHFCLTGTAARASLSPSIDEITLARDILLSPKLRSQYDRDLLTLDQQKRAARTQHPMGPAESLETIDLDDMVYSDATGCWTRPCRCGNATAFELREEDLANALVGQHTGRGQILVSCGGCSLHVEVAFEAADDDEVA